MKTAEHIDPYALSECDRFFNPEPIRYAPESVDRMERFLSALAFVAIVGSLLLNLI